jgi:hypothetical protein
MNNWTNVVIHHSASDFGCTRLITEWHKERGWKDIGYHFVILNGRPYSNWKEPIRPMVGSIEMGRPLNDDEWVQGNEIGAHCLGFNSNSLGICLVHLTKFYTEQIDSLFALCNFIGQKFNIPVSRFFGHYEKDKNKPDCPGFDMDLFREALFSPQGKKDFARYMLMNGKIITTGGYDGEFWICG